MLIGNHYSLMGFLILVLDIWAMVSILNSSSSVGTKVLWIILVLLLPVLGLVVWFLIGPKANR